MRQMNLETIIHPKFGRKVLTQYMSSGVPQFLGTQLARDGFAPAVFVSGWEV